MDVNVKFCGPILHVLYGYFCYIFHCCRANITAIDKVAEVVNFKVASEESVVIVMVMEKGVEGREEMEGTSDG